MASFLSAHTTTESSDGLDTEGGAEECTLCGTGARRNLENHAESLDFATSQCKAFKQPAPAQNDQTRRQKMKRKARKSVREYQIKIKELKTKVHEAWMSVEDANRQQEKLQAQAVEVQLNEIKDIKDEAENHKKKWSTLVLDLARKLQVLKQEHALLAKESHEWVSSLPTLLSLTQKVQDLVNEHNELKRKFAKQGQDLRLCYNQVLETKGNIRVFCRCRPLSNTELNAGVSSVLNFEVACNNQLIVHANGVKKAFTFDRVFTPSNTQVDVFTDTAPFVVSVLDGYNVCILAYGQTGTGKTFTMEGIETDRGVNYLTLKELFHVASQRKGQYEYDICVSVLEVYNEQIRDLLSQPALGQNVKRLEVKQAAEGLYVPGLTEKRVHCMEEMWEALQTGSNGRAVGSTNANEHSSRSHCMVCVIVKGKGLLTSECTSSKLWLVDLAGSERVAKTDVQGERLKEAQSINKSLSALGDVIYSLMTKSSHIPYRNSKLTHLLQDSLGGESKTLIFVQVSPSEHDLGETLCSLNFASRVRGVELGPARKQAASAELVKCKQLIEKAKQEEKLKAETLQNVQDTLKTKDQTCKVLSDKVRDKEAVLAMERKARSIAESKLKKQQQLMEQQQLQIEKLKEQVKAKDASRSWEPPAKKGTLNCSNVQEFRRPLSENFESGESLAEKQFGVPSRHKRGVSMCGLPRRRPSMAAAAPQLPMRACNSNVDYESSIRDENQPAGAAAAGIVTPAGGRHSLAPGTIRTPGITRQIQFRSPHAQQSSLQQHHTPAAKGLLNVNHPAVERGLGRRLSELLPRRRLSMAAAAAPHLPGRACNNNVDYESSLRENQPAAGIVTPAGGRPSLAPSTIMRPCLPPYIQFRSPHTQQSSLQRQHTPAGKDLLHLNRDPNHPLAAGEMGAGGLNSNARQLSNAAAAAAATPTWGRPPPYQQQRVQLQRKRADREFGCIAEERQDKYGQEHEQGMNKMRRVSMASPWAAEQQQQAVTQVWSISGGAQRVPIPSKNRSDSFHRGWYR